MSRKMIIYLALGVLGVVVLFVGSLAVRSALSTRPGDLGLVGGKLRPCPTSPNCVCTCATDDEHGIAPLVFEGTPEEAMERLRHVIKSMPRTEIVTDDEHYVHAEFRTALFRFTDDVEFVLDEEKKQIGFRSASRIGYSDLGTNRRRMEAVRAAYNQAE